MTKIHHPKGRGDRLRIKAKKDRFERKEREGHVERRLREEALEQKEALDELRKQILESPQKPVHRNDDQQDDNR